MTSGLNVEVFSQSVQISDIGITVVSTDFGMGPSVWVQWWATLVTYLKSSKSKGNDVANQQDSLGRSIEQCSSQTTPVFKKQRVDESCKSFIFAYSPTYT